MEVLGIQKSKLNIITDKPTLDYYYCVFGGYNGTPVFNGFIKLSLLDTILDFEYVYFHIIANYNSPATPRVVVDIQVRWEYSMHKIQDLLHFHRTGELIELNKELKEDETMFDNYTITDVEFGEINRVALKVAVKELAKELKGMKLEKDGDDTYLVKDGAVVKLDSKEFQAQVKLYVEGKTSAELRKNAAMYTIITKLGLIKSCKMTKPVEDLSTVFS